MSSGTATPDAPPYRPGLWWRGREGPVRRCLPRMGCLSCWWPWKEKFCQANFDADIVLKPTCSGEVVKDIGSDRKILSKRNLKLQVASQEVIFAERQGRLRNHERQPRHGKSAVRGDLLAPQDFSMPRATNVNVLGS